MLKPVRLRRSSLVVSVLVLLASAVLASPAAVAAPRFDSGALGRSDTTVDTGWRFHLGDVPGASASGFDDSRWDKVTLPHTWNGLDSSEGTTYRRDIGWYRTAIRIPQQDNGKRLYLQFDGAALVSDLWVDGRHVGRHEGGYAEFRYDITDFAAAGRTAAIAVSVDNRNDPDVAPISGDFDIEGGLYRDVHLLVTDPVHVDTLDFGGPGVYVRQNAVSAASADLTATVKVTNDESLARQVGVLTTVRDALGRPVATALSRIPVAALTTVTAVQPVHIGSPHLWNGLKDPYLYSVTSRVFAGAHSYDEVGVPLGLRTFSVDANQGFFLNGLSYPLHGVNTHQTMRPGAGVAVGAADTDADYALIRELGANAVRMVHYQHGQREYDDADRLGLVVWTEVPMVGFATGSAAFTANAEQQLRELVRQNYNHPSVAMFGIGNEQYVSSPVTNGLLTDLQNVVKAEDPDRYSTYAHCCASDNDPLANHADLTGYNRYYGWYDSNLDGLGPWADGLHRADPDRKIAVSEYGAGASILQHEQNGVQPAPGGTFHPEEWQATVAEHSWAAIKDKPYVWGSFVWAMFDFPSAGRNEGQQPGVNDKGLVTQDRAVRKDAFYFYQANWSSDPVLHITSSRDDVRFTASAAVKVYANTGPVNLTVNGVAAGTKTPDDDIVTWADVPLAPGRNVVVARSVRNGRPVTDTAVWYRETAAAGTSVSVDSGGPGDRDFSASTEGRTADPITGAPDPARYRTYRSGTFAYHLPLADGTYAVTLNFVDPLSTRPSQRVFGVNAEGVRVLSNLDVFSAVGRDTALDRTITVTVTGGVLDLEFVPVVGQAVVSGLTAVPVR